MQADTTLNLGNFQFARFEIPESIKWGGSQRTTEHELVGGQRVVDAMGRSDSPLAWSGLFRGANATERARQLDTMRAQGVAQKLTWGQFSYVVIVKEFEADYERFYQIPYRISCGVVSDQANPVTHSSPPSVDTDMANDFGAAMGLSKQVGDPTLGLLMGALGTAISLVPSFVNAPRSSIASVQQPLAAVQARTQILIGVSGNTLAGAPSFGGVQAGISPALSAAALIGQSANHSQLSTLYLLGSLVGRMGANLGAISTSSNTVTTAGGNLFSVASQQYGDPTAWTGIAKANDLTDPFVQGAQTLNIPPQPDNADGILFS